MDIIKERNPNKIGLNFSEHFALADGLVKTDYEAFIKNLPKDYIDKLMRLVNGVLITGGAADLF